MVLKAQRTPALCNQLCTPLRSIYTTNHLDNPLRHRRFNLANDPSQISNSHVKCRYILTPRINRSVLTMNGKEQTLVTTRVKYEDGLHVIVRFAALGRAILRREEVWNEVAAMKYIRQTTTIPVPGVVGSSICWAGPYIVMPFLEGDPLSQLLKDRSIEGRPGLNLQISDRSLKRTYREIA